MNFRTEKEFEDTLVAKLTKLDNQWDRNVLEYSSEKDLIDNWARILFMNNNQPDRLNGYPLTNTEMGQIISEIYEYNPFKANRMLNNKYITIYRDHPEEPLQKRVDLFLFDKDEIAAGRSVYQIARQPELPTGHDILGDDRGDLMLLINGMPLYHIELKKNAGACSNAISEFKRYMHNNVYTGFFALVQIMVAMDPDETLYFARPASEHEFNSDYYFHWADFNNNAVYGWEQIAERFLSIPMAHRMIGYGTVADGEDKHLKVMRSYQYYAAYGIYSEVARRTDWTDDHQKGGYIYHTTGSGKTMTSFKCAQLIKSSGKVDKIVFLMDRDELWKQTYDNYRNYSDCDAIEDTSNTINLLSKLENDTSSLLIVTSIQKMSLLTTVEPNRYKARIEKVKKEKKIVFIIDEAHRSTFGTMLRDIRKTYTNAMFFGFTGTPIIEVNARGQSTTQSLFGRMIHKYTILQGVKDKNVLGFMASHLNTFDTDDIICKTALRKIGKSREEDLTDDEMQTYISLCNRPLSEIEQEIPSSVYSDDNTGALHRQNVVRDILEKWDRISFRGKYHYILATSSIVEAIKYYRLLKNNDKGLFVTALFDPHTDDPADPETAENELFKQDGVVEILRDYGMKTGLMYRVGQHASFKDDVCARLAHKKPYEDMDSNRNEAINIVIVVNQLLTGFDSKWINTLYLDKVLLYDQFIQAVSRTNRLNGPDKQYGIVKYCRYPHFMAAAGLEALKAYVETGYEEVLAPSLGQNIISMNHDFAMIEQLFSQNGIGDFSALPQNEADMKLFGKLFKNIRHYYYCSVPQLFSWDQKEYDTEDAGKVVCNLDGITYEKLYQRFREIPRSVQPGDDDNLDLKENLTETPSATVNRSFMESKFREAVKDLTNGAASDEVQELLNEIKSQFALLSRDEQQIAEVILDDILSGELRDFDPDKSFSEYIADYTRKQLMKNIIIFCDAFGYDPNKMYRIISFHLNEENLYQGGLYDEILLDLDKEKAKEVMESIEGIEIRPHRVKLKAQEYLKRFILSEGRIWR